MKIELREFLKSNAEDVNNDGRERTSENFLLRAMRTLTKIEQLFPELWELTKGLQQSGNIYSRKMAEFQQKQYTLYNFNLLCFYSPLSSSTIALKTNCPQSWWKLAASRSHWKGQNKIGTPSKPHSQRIVITWPVWWFLERHSQDCLYLTWCGALPVQIAFSPSGYSLETVRGSCWTSRLPVIVNNSWDKHQANQKA